MGGHARHSTGNINDAPTVVCRRCLYECAADADQDQLTGNEVGATHSHDAVTMNGIWSDLCARDNRLNYPQRCGGRPVADAANDRHSVGALRCIEGACSAESAVPIGEQLPTRTLSSRNSTATRKET